MTPEEIRTSVENGLRWRFRHIDTDIHVSVNAEKMLIVRWCSGLRGVNGRYTCQSYITTLDAPIDEITRDLEEDFMELGV